MKKFLGLAIISIVLFCIANSADARPFGRVARFAFRAVRAPVAGAVHVVHARPGWVIPKRHVNWCEW